ncbi:hypothetical protein [Rickettsia amblyommatis]|uniref:Uncharacterized protein n=1 Tax=Rickettsia amblyommatis str. Ac/Pa TaxID=1359164 RepID=A0A0F3N1L1_RICAM|nr:hypothetical protein [Rickettsia amblyommatis]KJV61903.1 hypothetical protein APHACPA_0919 [Rickettsia amblyommatis str. Ac/Pa]
MKDFKTADSAEKVYDLIIENAPTRASIFIDVDDTLITPKSKTFKKPPYNQIIDRIKENKSSYDNYEEIISNWRLQRKVILSDEEGRSYKQAQGKVSGLWSYTNEYGSIRQYSFYARLAI